MEKLSQPSDNAIPSSTTRKLDDDDLQDSSSTSQRPNKTTKLRYSRTHLLKLNEDVKLKDPPEGYNPAVLTYRSVEGVKESSMKDSVPPAKWNRSPSLGANWQGGGGGGGGRGPRNQSQYSRLIEGVEDPTSGPNAARGRALRSAVSWHEDRSGTTPPERSFSRKNSRSDGPGRWDNNKDEISGSLEKRPSQGPERWPSYGHRDLKDKHQKAAREEFEETEELFPPPPGAQQQQQYHQHHHHHGDQDPPWMHHQEARNSEKVEQHRKSAAEFEQKRKQMRETLAKEKKDGNGGENAMFMTDEEINKYKKELEAEERGISSSSAVYTFDSFKEALKSQGVANLPPMPTSGMNTVDQIEKSMKATAAAATQPTVSEIERQKLELLKLASGGGQGGANLNQTGPSVTGGGGGGNMEGANLLLSMLRGQNRPPTAAGGVLHPNQVPGQLGGGGGYPQMSIQQQQQLLASAGGTPLERLFTNNQRTGLQPNVGNLGLGFGGGGGGQTPQQQQPLALPPGLGNVNIPYMQQANPQAQLNPRPGIQAMGPPPPGAQQNPLFSALMANQAQQSAQQRVKQAQMMAHLKQAQQQMALPHSRPVGPGVEQDFGMNTARSAPTNTNDRDNDKDNDLTANQQPPAAAQTVQNQIPLHSFGLAGQGGFRPQIPAVGGMINPAMIGGGVQPGLFQGGGLGAHPGLFMQNGGGGLGRPTGPPGLNPLAFTGMRPNPEMSGLMENRQAQMSLLGMQQNPGMNLQASMLAQQQGTGNLNRFFGMSNPGAGTAPSFAPTGGPGGPGVGEPNPPTAGNETVTGRGRSFEELKNEAQ